LNCTRKRTFHVTWHVGHFGHGQTGEEKTVALRIAREAPVLAALNIGAERVPLPPP